CDSRGPPAPPPRSRPPTRAGADCLPVRTSCPPAPGPDWSQPGAGTIVTPTGPVNLGFGRRLCRKNRPPAAQAGRPANYLGGARGNRGGVRIIPRGLPTPANRETEG